MEIINAKSSARRGSKARVRFESAGSRTRLPTGQAQGSIDPHVHSVADGKVVELVKDQPMRKG